MQKIHYISGSINIIEVPEDFRIIKMSSKRVFCFCAADSMGDDYHSEPMESKRYSVDHSDTAFGVMTSQYMASKSTYGFRSGAAYSGGVCRPAASPSAFQEGNRSGKRLRLTKAIMFPNVYTFICTEEHRAQRVIHLYMHMQKVLDFIMTVITQSVSLHLPPKPTVRPQRQVSQSLLRVKTHPGGV